MKLSLIAASIFGAALLVPTAQAQAVDFGAWCSRIAHYGADRCLENRPEDRKAYDGYVTTYNTAGSYDGEKNRKDENRDLEHEKTDRMGDVTPDQLNDHSAANGH